jgi:hypothetical protein
MKTPQSFLRILSLEKINGENRTKLKESSKPLGKA